MSLLLMTSNFYIVHIDGTVRDMIEKHSRESLSNVFGTWRFKLSKDFEISRNIGNGIPWLADDIYTQ